MDKIQDSKNLVNFAFFELEMIQTGTLKKFRQNSLGSKFFLFSIFLFSWKKFFQRKILTKIFSQFFFENLKAIRN